MKAKVQAVLVVLGVLTDDKCALGLLLFNGTQCLIPQTL